MNLDNAHDYFKLTFTKMRAPSFFVDQEHERGLDLNIIFEYQIQHWILGLTLHYRSHRRGFSCYVLGQMKEIARVVYKQDLQIKLKKQEIAFDTVIVQYTYSRIRIKNLELYFMQYLISDWSLTTKHTLIFKGAKPWDKRLTELWSIVVQKILTLLFSLGITSHSGPHHFRNLSIFNSLHWWFENHSSWSYSENNHAITTG